MGPGQSNKGRRGVKGAPSRSAAFPRTRALAALLLCAAARPSGAQEAVPRFDADIRQGLVHLDYAERYQGATIDREQGFLLAIKGSLGVRSTRLFGRLELESDFGMVDYNGHVQAQHDQTLNGLPLAGRSGAIFLKSRLEGGSFVGPARRLAAFVGLGARVWFRNIQDMTATSTTGVPTTIPGYSEVYTWWEVDLGARYTFLDLRRDHLDLEARFVETFAPRMQVTYQGQNLTFDLGARPGWRAGVTYRHDFRPRLFLVAEVYGEGYAFGASAVNTFSLLEPDSQTVLFGLDVGLGWRF